MENDEKNLPQPKKTPATAPETGRIKYLWSDVLR
jgi:hypothetical protein